MSMTFGEYLAACMKAAGYPSPASLSRATGIGEGVLSRWLNDKGTDTPRTYMLRRLVPALHIPLIELVVAAGIMSPDEARLDEAPRPPQALDTEVLDSLIDNSAMTDDLKGQVRAELERLRRTAQEQDRRSRSRSTVQTAVNAPGNDRRSG